MKAKLAFYKGDGNIVDKTIRWYTRSSYSHVELVIGNDWFSTSPRDLAVRMKRISPAEGNWEFVDVEVDLNKVMALFSQTKAAKYDWLGIALSQFMPFNLHSKNRWFCSEWCLEALGVPNSNKYSPEDAYQFVTKGTVK